MATNNIKTKEIDITKTGPQSYRDLQKANEAAYKGAASESIFANIQNPKGYIRPSDIIYEGGEYSPIYSQSKGKDYYGNSIFDEPYVNEEQYSNLGDIRAENQPWYAQIGAGLAKGAVLAGTTFLDGTVGLLLGAAQAFGEQRDSALWDNDFSKAMQSINEWSEQVLPNYYTKEEQEQPWYENIFTANFLGDKFIKNLGFTVGAFYGGNLGASLLKGGISLAQGTKIGANIIGKASNLAKTIGVIKDASQFPSIVTSGVGSVISAVNEGRIEALNNSTDWFELQKAMLDDKFGVIDGDTSYLSDNELRMYNDMLGKISEDRLKMGNMDLLMNIPILTASNLIQFGRMYANGFKTARKATNIVNKAGEYAIGKTTGKTIGRAVLNSASEGMEEISQKAASTISGLAYEQDVNNFYKSKINPEAEQQTINWIKAFAQGINETVNDASSWEEFTIGALTGALGIPVFGKANTSSTDTYLGRNKVLGLRGGIAGEILEQREQLKREQNIVDYMNSRVQSPEFKNYYQGLIRHNKYQNDMNKAVENNDEFEFKNAEHAQLVSDIAMFDNAGKLEDLKTLISSAYDTSDDNLASIIENTTSILDNGDLVGPFAQYAIKNSDNTISANFGNEESKQNMINKLTQNKNDIFSTIKQYQTIRDEIDIRTGQQLSDEQLEELTWLKSQISNWQDRASELSNEIKPTLGTAIGSISQLINKFTSIKTKEGQLHAGLSDLYKEADKNERKLRENMSVLETIRGLDNKVFAYLLASDPNLVKDIKSTIENPISGIDADDVQTINNKIDDVVKLVNATGKFNTKLKEYLENPIKLQENIINATESTISEELNRKSETLKNNISNAKSYKEFKDILNKETDDNLKENVLKSLNENSKIKDYLNSSRLEDLLYKEIDNSDNTDEVKSQLKEMVSAKFNTYDNYSDYSNSNLIVDLGYANQDELDYKFKEILNKVNKDISNIEDINTGTKLRKDKPNSDMNKDTVGNDDNATVPSVKEKSKFADIIDSLDSQPEIVKQELKPVINSIRSIYNKANTKKTEEDYNNAISAINGFISYLESEGNNIIEDSNFLESLKSKMYSILDTIPENNPDVTDSQVLNYLDNDYESVSESKEKKYYRPAISEFNIKELRGGKFIPFNKSYSEYTTLYNFLEKAGAFKYINEGNLKAGDKLALKLEKIGDNNEIAMYKGNQVVGVLPSLKTAIDNKYIGLPKVIERVRKGEQVTLTVNKILLGKYRYNREKVQSLKNLNKDNLKLGIQDTKFGKVRTNTNDNVEPVYNEQQAVGKVYVLLPNSRGTLSPKLVRIKHFNKEEFDLNVLKDTENSRAKYLHTIISNLTKVDNIDESTKQLNNLRRVLYLDKTFHLNYEENGNTTQLVIRWKDKNTNEYIRKYITLAKITHSLGEGTIEIGDSNSVSYDEASIEKVDTNIIYNQILDALYSYNPVFNVNKNKINKEGYNESLINDDILYTYLTSTQMEGSWFTTNYITEEGVEAKAENPKGMFNPTNTNGIKVSLSGNEYTVINNNIYDREGNIVTPKNSGLIKDIAFCNETYGSRVNGVNMINNKVLLHSGTIGLDRNTNKYITGKELDKLKFDLNELPKKQLRVSLFIDKLNEDQSKVKRDSNGVPDTSDNENGESVYRILEDDGQYHEYKRVHSIIGSNWTGEALKSFKDNNNNLAVIYGNLIDELSRQYFNNNGNISKPDNMSEQAFNTLKKHLDKVKKSIEDKGESLLTNRIVVFHKYADGTRIAGELDVLSINANLGEVNIYDFKTSRYPFSGDNSLFSVKTSNQIRSTKDQYALQLSSYKNIIESSYDITVNNMALMPSVIKYNNNELSSLSTEKGILLPYISSPVILDKPTSTSNKQNTKEDSISKPLTSIKGTFFIESKLKGNQKVTEDIIPFEEVNGHKYYYYKLTIPPSDSNPNTLYRHYLILENGKSIDMTGLTTEDNSDNSIFNEIFKQVKQNYKVLEADAKNDLGLGQSVTISPKQNISKTQDISNYTELKKGDIVYITGFSDKLPDGTIKKERSFIVDALGKNSANLIAKDADYDIGLTDKYIRTLKEENRRIYISRDSKINLSDLNQKDTTKTTNLSESPLDTMQVDTSNMGIDISDNNINSIANEIMRVNPIDNEFVGMPELDTPDLSMQDSNEVKGETPKLDFTEVEYTKLPEEFRKYLEDALGANSEEWESLSKEDKEYYLHCFGI